MIRMPVVFFWLMAFVPMAAAFWSVIILDMVRLEKHYVFQQTSIVAMSVAGAVTGALVAALLAMFLERS